MREEELLDRPDVKESGKLNVLPLMLIGGLALLHAWLLSSFFLGVGGLSGPLIGLAILGSFVFGYFLVEGVNRQGALLGAIALIDAIVVFILRALFEEMALHSAWILFHLILLIIVVIYMVFSVMFIAKTVKSRVE